MREWTDIREVVRDRYGAIAEGAGAQSCCSTGSQGGQSACGCGSGADPALASLGYSADQAKAVPEGANLGLGCGNPLAHAGVRPGETVLDLGSGAGIDAFLAAREVGHEGRVIGVDMTEAMIRRARRNAARGGWKNVEFRLGEIEHLPAGDASVDVVISNCVVNLSPEKPAVFREALRVLRPAGRMVVSDIVLVRPLPEGVRQSVEAYIGCVAGASLKDDYLRLIREAGFEDVEVVEERGFAAGDGQGAAEEAGAWDAVRSIKVRARKPAA